MADDTSAIPVDMFCQTAVYPRKTVSSLYASLKYEDKGLTKKCRMVRAAIITAFTGYIHREKIKYQSHNIWLALLMYYAPTSAQLHVYMYTKYIIEKLPHYAQKVHRSMQHQSMYNLTHNQCLCYMYLSANATSAVHKRICNA